MKPRTQLIRFLRLLFLLGVLLGACQPAPVETGSPGPKRLQVVATTTFIGDVVENIAGDKVELVVLLQPGQNPHSYQPIPRDLVTLNQADLLFVNGLGLEEFLDDLLDGSDTEAEVVVVSDGIIPLVVESGFDQDHAADDHDPGENQGHSGGQDPHVWFNPNNLLVWVDNITAALVDLDPGNGDFFLANAADYRSELVELDGWIREQLEAVPVENRQLVTDHNSLAYFSEQYGLEQIGAVIPALTTEAETSGQQLAALIDTIREHQARAIFIGIDFDPTLARRVSEETGVELVPLYFGSLSEGDPAGTCLDFTRYNVQTIVEALK